MLTKLCQAANDGDVKQGVKPAPEHSATALFEAVSWNRPVGVIQYLLKSCKINQNDKNKAFLDAAALHRSDVLKILSENGADPKARSSEDHSALYEACWSDMPFCYDSHIAKPYLHQKRKKTVEYLINECQVSDSDKIEAIARLINHDSGKDVLRLILKKWMQRPAWLREALGSAIALDTSHGLSQRHHSIHAVMEFLTSGGEHVNPASPDKEAVVIPDEKITSLPKQDKDALLHWAIRRGARWYRIPEMILNSMEAQSYLRALKIAIHPDLPPEYEDVSCLYSTYSPSQLDTLRSERELERGRWWVSTLTEGTRPILPVKDQITLLELAIAKGDEQTIGCLATKIMIISNESDAKALENYLKSNNASPQVAELFYQHTCLPPQGTLAVEKAVPYHEPEKLLANCVYLLTIKSLYSLLLSPDPPHAHPRDGTLGYALHPYTKPRRFFT